MDRSLLGTIRSAPCELALRAATAAGLRIKELFGSNFTSSKKQVSGQTQGMVTQADLEAELIIVDQIRQLFPNHNILSEESHSQFLEVVPDHIWVVDPLDGTNNFAFGIPHFSVSIAYYAKGEPAVGIVHDPMRDDWFVAARNEGAWWNGHRAHVCQNHSLADVIAAFGFYYDRGQMMAATLEAIRELFQANVIGVRRFGSAALDLAYVGIGRFGTFFEYQLSPWDYAAGQLFVSEAGGIVTTCQGLPLKLAKTSILATNEKLHAQLLGIVKKHWPN